MSRAPTSARASAAAAERWVERAHLAGWLIVAAVLSVVLLAGG